MSQQAVNDIEFTQFLRDRLPEARVLEAFAYLIHFRDPAVKQSLYAVLFWIISNDRVEKIHEVFECMKRNTSSDPGMALLAISGLSRVLEIADFPALLEEFPAQFEAHCLGTSPQDAAGFDASEFEEIIPA